MAMKAIRQEQPIPVYEFGSFLADTGKCILARDGEVVPLSLKAFEILVLLIEHRGQVVAKDEILRLIWPDTVVEENNLARHISALRKALDEQPNQHRYILTIPGHGYRFVAQVREVEDDGTAFQRPVPNKVHETVTTAPLATVAPFPVPVEPVITKREAMRRGVVRHWRKLGMLLLALIVLGYVLSLVRPRSPGDSPALQRKLWQLTFDAGLESEPTWSPDGRMMAYSADRGGNFDLWLQPVGEGNPMRVTTSPAHDWQPDWAPEGNRLVFRSEREGGGLYVVPVLGGTERKVANFGYRPRWSPEGNRILFYSFMLRNNTAEIPKVYWVGLEGEQPHEVLSGFLREFRTFRVAWHPDGQRISIWGNHRQQGWGFWTAALTGGTPIKSEFARQVSAQLQDAEVTLADFSWSASGQALYFEGVARRVRNLWKVEVEPSSLRWVAGPERLTTGTGMDTDLALSRDGKKLAFTVRAERTRIWSLPFDAAAGKVKGEGQPVTDAGIDPRFPDLSPDGQRLVFATPRAGKWELRSKQLKEGTEKLLVADDFSRAVPRLSRDGLWLAYRRARATTAERPHPERTLVLLPTSGGEEQLLTTPTALADLAWDWSKDGQWILGGCDRQSPGRMMLVLFPLAAAPHAETQMRIIASPPDENLYQARYAPDERWISFCAAKITDAGVSSIFVIPPTGGARIPITEGKFFDDKPRWSPDGRTLYFISNRTGFFNVWGIRFDPATGHPASAPFRVTAFDNPNQMILDDIRFMEIALAADRLILPIMEVSGGIWVLENVER